MNKSNVMIVRRSPQRSFPFSMWRCAGRNRRGHFNSFANSDPFSVSLQQHKLAVVIEKLLLAFGECSHMITRSVATPIRVKEGPCKCAGGRRRAAPVRGLERYRTLETGWAWKQRIYHSLGEKVHIIISNTAISRSCRRWDLGAEVRPLCVVQNKFASA